MPLTKVLVRESTRDQVDSKIVLRRDLADKIQADPNLRVMIYCASDPLNPYTLTDIAFPHQVEIKINEDEVKANTRGLKNKPGSTRPADITKLLRIRADYSNVMKVTYALTNKVSTALFRNSFPSYARYTFSICCSHCSVSLCSTHHNQSLAEVLHHCQSCQAASGRGASS